MEWRTEAVGNLERIQSAGGVLLGRTSYQGFSSNWPCIVDAPEDPANRALSLANRELSRIAKVRDWLAGARQREGGDILVYGSRTLWNGLLVACPFDGSENLLLRYATRA